MKLTGEFKERTVAVLRERFPFEDSRALAAELGLSFYQVRRLAAAMGIRKQQQLKRITPEQTKIIEELYATTDTNVIAKMVGITAKSVRRRAAAMGITKSVVADQRTTMPRQERIKVINKLFNSAPCTVRHEKGTMCFELARPGVVLRRHLAM